jgi:dipeptidyl aminopeptidase/acylaminoacyl peptidase
LGGCKNAIDVLVPAGMLWHNGLNVLLIDVRDVGDSDPEDGWSSAGNDESLDVLGAWDWLVTTKGYTPERIGIFGVSMGGATSLFAFQDEPRIAALFVEGTFASLLAVVADQMTGYGLPGFMAQPAAAIFRLVSKENIMAHTPIAAMRSARSRPVYIVHSHGDRRISISQSHELAAAALDAGVNVKAWFPERSEHLQTPALYPEEFERRLVGFFREALGQ